jgi:hypothetical protein
MEAKHKILNGRFIEAGLMLSSLVLVICLSGLPAAAQGQQNENSATVDQMDGRSGPDMAPQYSGPENQSGPAGQMRAPMDVPPTLTLQAGTLVPVRISEWLSSDKNHVGDRFTATLEQPLIANGWVVAQRGQMVTGRVAVAEKAGRARGVSQLGVELNELTLVDGQLLPLKTQLLQSSGGTSNGRDVAAVATTTGVGAAIGAGVEGGEGAGIGAGIGAAAGIIGVLSTRGRATVIPPEALLTFRVEVPVNVSTERSQVAFRPVGQSGYRGDQGDQDAYSNPRERRYVDGPGYPPAPSYYPTPWYGYGYYPGYYYPSYYPGISFGYYGYYGPRFGGGFRGGSRGGFRGGRR